MSACRNGCENQCLCGMPGYPLAKIGVPVQVLGDMAAENAALRAQFSDVLQTLLPFRTKDGEACPVIFDCVYVHTSADGKSVVIEPNCHIRDEMTALRAQVAELQRALREIAGSRSDAVSRIIAHEALESGCRFAPHINTAHCECGFRGDK